MNWKPAFVRIRTLAVVLIVSVVMATPSWALDVYLIAREFVKTMPDGVTQVTMWGFAEDEDGDLNTLGSEIPLVPGPLIIVPDSDPTLTIHFRNDLTGPNVPISIVIPGQMTLLAPVRDGIRATSFAHQTAPGAIGTYSWTNLKPGTYLYHSGTHPAVQVQMGLYGGVLKNHGPGTFPSLGEAYPGVEYDNEIVLFYSEIDLALHEAVDPVNPSQLPTYGTEIYPSTLHYKPDYFLINGEPYPLAEPFFPALVPHGLLANERVLVRFLNAGLKTHVPTLLGPYMDLIAEDGNPYPYRKHLYSVFLAASKTVDAIWVPTAADSYAVVDRRHYLTDYGISGGGMLTQLVVTTDAGAPQAVNDTYTVSEDTILTTAAPGILSNDIGTGLAVSLDSPVQDVGAGTLALFSDGSFTYTPAPDFNGTDFFTYKATDGILTSNVAMASIQVTPVNDQPSAIDDAAFTVEGTPVVIDILANDIDVDGDPLTVTNLTDPLVVLNPDSTVTFTPPLVGTGVFTFTYTANDGIVDSNFATVSVTVDPRVNTPPVAVDDYVSTPRNVPVFINLVANDYDPDGTIDPSPASFTIVTSPTRGGVVSIVTDGVIFTPKNNFRGTDVFSYTVKDNEGASSNTATVRVNVLK